MTNTTIQSKRVDTKRLDTHYLAVSPASASGLPIVFLHGNLSDAEYWRGTMTRLAQTLPARPLLAPDLRCFGRSEDKAIDATRGMGDFADDLAALLAELSLTRVVLVAHSAGGGVAMRFALEHPAQVAGLVLVDPLSPFGFGGTRDAAGTPTCDDYAGSGGGTAAPDMVARLRSGDRSEEAPTSPRTILRTCYVKPPFVPADEETLLDAMFRTTLGDHAYPGDSVESPNWPGVAPGTRGMNNAISPKYLRLSEFASLRGGPPVLWVRGADDVIVSDTSLFDFGYLGQLGAVPGWPGEDACPPQPMVAQMRHVLDGYRAAGGSYREVVIADAGHSPQVEKPEEFESLLTDFLEQIGD